jgi:prolipoprotein diacylglyceryl transferase
VLLASIPSPDQGVWHLGPLPIRAYALCIVAGAVVALWLSERRWQARGGRPGGVYDIAVWAIPFGLVGARLYHVVTTPDLYFGENGSLVEALYVWQGGLGIWGAVAMGALGAWIGCRRAGIRLPAFADAVAPGIVLAQGIGRWGNWFNQELFGRPTGQPWGLEIAPDNRPLDFAEYATFHPTFLYESLWDVGVALVVIVVDQRRRLGHGRAFALYVVLYTLGRTWIEQLRIDESLHPLGIRLNVFTSLVICLLAVAYMVISSRLRPGREVSPYRPGHEPGEGTDPAPVEAGVSGPSTGTSTGTATGPATGASGPGPSSDGGASPGADTPDGDGDSRPGRDSGRGHGGGDSG